MPAVAKGYAGKYCNKIFFPKTDRTNTFLLLAMLLVSYSVFHKITSNTFLLLGVLCFSQNNVTASSADFSVQERDQFIELSFDGGLMSEFNKALLSGVWLKRRAEYGLIFGTALKFFDPFQYVRSL